MEVGGTRVNVLIVYAHEEPQSFNGALRDRAVSVLTGAGHTVEVSDLYAMDFDPVGGKSPGLFGLRISNCVRTG